MSVASVSILGSLWPGRKELRSQRCGAGLLHSGWAGFELSCLRRGTKLSFQDFKEWSQWNLRKGKPLLGPKVVGTAGQNLSPLW